MNKPQPEAIDIHSRIMQAVDEYNKSVGLEYSKKPETELVWTGDKWERIEPVEPDPPGEPIQEGTVRIKQARDMAGRLVWSVRDGVTVRNFDDRDFRSRILWEIFRYSANLPRHQRLTFIIEPWED